MTTSVLDEPESTRNDRIIRELHRLEHAQAEFLLDHLGDVEPDDRLMDGGSGRGGTSFMAHERFGCQVDGVTISEYQVEFANNQAAQRGVTDKVKFHFRLSVAKDMADEKPPCNMVLQVAADRGCSIEEATEITVKLHNDLVHDFEASHRSLQAVPCVKLQRYLRGLRAWMGGAFEWHDSNPRYKTGGSGPR